MRLVCFAAFLCLAGHIAAADDRVERSCRQHNAPDDLQDYVTLDSPGYPKVEATLQRLEQGDPFENAFRAGALGEFMLMGLADVVPPGLAAVCSYDMYDANECAGNAFWPSNVEDVRLDGQALSFTTKPSESRSFQEVSISNPAFDRFTVNTTDGAVTATAT